MIHDQADELRQLVRNRAAAGDRCRPTAPVVVVSGGKGDVGTTTTAANLAVALARQGRRAVLVDADLDHGGNTHWSSQAPRGSVIDVLAGRRSVADLLQRGPSGIQVVPGAWPAGAAGECTEPAMRRLIDELKNLAPHADAVIVDAGSGRGPLVRRLWQAATLVLVVATPEPAAIREGYAVIKVLAGNEPAAAIHVLVNRAATSAVALDVHARIGEACRKFLGLHAVNAGYVEFCGTVGPQEPVLIYPARSASARGLERVADSLRAQTQNQRVRGGSDAERASGAMLATDAAEAGLALAGVRGSANEESSRNH